MESRDCRYSIGYTYYNEPELLKQQISLWEKYPKEIEIIVVDDGSVEFPAYDVLKNVKFNNGPAISLYQVTEDLGFNSHGCRNLIATVAASDNILFLDIDCQLSPTDAVFLRRVIFKQSALYKFHLWNAPAKKWTAFPGAVNCFLVNRNDFWSAGGYDESFTGYHKGDREFLARLSKITHLHKISESFGITIVRGGRKIIIDESVDKTTYDDVNMLLKVPHKVPSDEDLSGKIATKINFSYILTIINTV